MARRGRNGLRKGPLQRLLCKLGRHYRDRNNVRRQDGVWTSVCTGCGLAMVKTNEQWAVRPRTRGKRVDVPTI